LVFTEMTCVSPTARITPGCTGMYAADHVAAWRRITEFVHRHSAARMCLQLGHSGGKGSTQLGWEIMDAPLYQGNWPLIAASDVPWSASNQTPRPMTRADMDEVRDQFVAATRMGIEAGFDMVELHAAHGYLLSSFITPLRNKRTDDYGGSLANRLRFPLEVFEAMRAAWPKERPMSVRISATDWAGEEGVTPDEAVLIGDAAHTAHFSIGSGTKLAVEDAIKLADVLNQPGRSLAEALADYHAERSIEVLKLQNSARNSTEWFEAVDRYLGFEPWQFAYSLLTRSQRISHENLRLRDGSWLGQTEASFWEAATGKAKTAPPMFAPFRLRELSLANRIVVSPMAT
jgi:2,4-dienoyl-CoA reductase-like NADH-dependent reductase (Old Yellow Enzyme family)